MKYKKSVCSFTGYRPQKLPFGFDEDCDGAKMLKANIKDEIIRLIDADYDVFQGGMAQGTDLFCAELVLEARREAPAVKFVAVIPCLGQEERFTEANKRRYKAILEQADELRYINRIPYFDGCMWMRNKNLVDTCDRLIAVFDGQQGGTKQTVRYARKSGKKVTVFDPFTNTRIELIEDMRQLQNQEYFRRFYD